MYANHYFTGYSGFTDATIVILRTSNFLYFSIGRTPSKSKLGHEKAVYKMCPAFAHSCSKTTTCLSYSELFLNLFLRVFLLRYVTMDDTWMPQHTLRVKSKTKMLYYQEIYIFPTSEHKFHNKGGTK